MFEKVIVDSVCIGILFSYLLGLLLISLNERLMCSFESSQLLFFCTEVLNCMTLDFNLSSELSNLLYLTLATCTSLLISRAISMSWSSIHYWAS